MLNLKIITPQKEVLTREVERVTCQTTEGEITILPRHVALLTILTNGVIKVKSKEGTEYFSAGAGYVETDGREVRILISRAQGQTELDEKKVLEVVAEAKKLLAQERSAVDRRNAFAMLQRATIDLKVIKKFKRTS